MSALVSRLVKLETERTRRRRLRIAETVAGMEGVTVEEAFERSDVDPTDAAAIAERFGCGLVDVGAVTRFLAQRHGLTAAEAAEAAATAELLLAQLEARDGAAPWA